MKAFLIGITAWCWLTACSEPAPRSSVFSQPAASASVGAQVVPERPVVWPQDHASHPAFALEWWYLTFVLSDEQQRQYGLQFTLFRFTTNPPYDSHWTNGQQWMGHASLHTPTAHFYEERLAGGGVGNAGVSAAPFMLAIDNWQWVSANTDLFPSVLQFSIQNDVSVELALTTSGPLIAHGQGGYSEKSASGKYRSYYYSQPFIQASGQLAIGPKQGSAATAVKVKGQGWFDHEWSSQLANNDALGWDWFSVHLKDGAKLTVFTMHVKGEAPYTTGTFITAHGESTTLAGDALSITASGYEAINGQQVPVEWQIDLAEPAMHLTIKPFKPGQWNPGRVAYYEGRIQVSGSHQGTGFMELTGYQ